MAEPFAGKVAILTGASSGIGKAMAIDLAKQGAKVGLIARRANLLEELASQIRSSGGKVAAAPADVTDWPQTRDAIAKIEAELGPTDLMIANAGLGVPTPLDAEGHARDAGDTMRINVIGVIHALAAVIPGMIERKKGHLAAISSLAAYVSLPGESAYCASKAAVNSYMSGLRTQLRPKGIKVTTICPGFIATPMTAKNDFAMPGLLTAEAASERMLCALANGREIYNFPWITVQLIRLARWMPEWALRKSAGTYKEKAI
jgi:short-subunit dehydrogenase